MDINNEILKRMANGSTQKEISEQFKKLGITPNSTSIIDKRLKAIKIEMSCKTIFQVMYKLGKKDAREELQ